MKNQKNKLFMLLLLVLMPATFATIESYQTQVNMSLTNETFSLKSEDNQVRTYTCGTNLYDQLTINLYRNTTCRESELYDFLKAYVVASGDNETVSYKTQYDQCVASSLILNSTIIQLQADSKDGSTNVTWRTKYDACNQQVTSAQNSQSQLSTCNSDLKKAQDDKTTYAIFGAVAGAIACYLFMKPKYASTPTEQLPRMR